MKANVLDVVRRAHDAACVAYQALLELEYDERLDEVEEMADTLQAALFEIIESADK